MAASLPFPSVRVERGSFSSWCAVRRLGVGGILRSKQEARSSRSTKSVGKISSRKRVSTPLHRYGPEDE